MKLQDKWALITGASRGIGKLIAKDLAEKKCKIILHSRTLNGTKSILNELKSKNLECYSIAAELTDFKQIDFLISKVKEITGDHLDILYNNAAIMTDYKALFEPSVEDYQQSFMVNSIAPAKLCDAFIPSMLKNNWGRIINVTSGISNNPSLMPYSCSKAALERYVRDIVSTLKGSNVLINLLDPGWLKTDLGGPEAPDDPESVLPGATIPVCLKNECGSGKLYKAQHYKNKKYNRSFYE